MLNYYNYDKIYGTLLSQNTSDTVRTYFVVECQVWSLKRWMFQYGWSFPHKDKAVMKDGLLGFEVTLEKDIQGRRQEMSNANTKKK